MKRREPEESTTYKEDTTPTEPVGAEPGPPQESGTGAANGPRGLGTEVEERDQKEA